MRLFVALLLTLSATCLAGEKVHFYGTWEPRPALRAFWRPIRESWWKPAQGTESAPLARHCKEFAKQNAPEAIIPEMIADLKAYQSEVHWFVYLSVMLHWPQKRVLRALAPFDASNDPVVHHIANEFIADVESPE
jgi:hypothetical protein